jgi:hypothetical protein
MRRAVVAVALVLAACGPGPEAAPGVDLTLVASAGLLDIISAFQIALVTNGSDLDCVRVQNTCIKNQVDASRFVTVKDASGKAGPAVVVPISLTPGTPNTQDASLHDVPPGKNFALVVEAISKDSPPRLAGSACNYVKQIDPGSNSAVLSQIVVLSPMVSCDPRL